MMTQTLKAESIIVGTCTLDKLLTLEDSSIIKIPDYQRPYVWDKEKIDVLLKDLIDFFKTKKENEMYYMGSVLFYKKDENTYEIIDGQQRLTTLLILDYVIRGDDSYLFLFQNSDYLDKNIKRHI